MLFGKSELGKTSLLQAGLFPRLRQHDLLPLTVRLNDTERPLLALFFDPIEEQCRRCGIDYTPGNTASLWEFFKTALFLRGERLQTPVLVCDQFEELFTLQDDARRAALVRELADLTSGRLPQQIRTRRRAGETLPYSDRPPEVKIILSLREDYLGALQELTSELLTILEQRFRLTEFGEAQARAAMEEPAKVADEQLFRTRAFRYEKEVMQQVLTFLKGRTGSIEPFQLQILCQYVEQQVRLEQSKGQTDMRVGFILVLRQRHAAELAEVPAQQAEAGEKIAQAAADKARRARDEAERLLSFLLFDLRDKLQPVGRLDLMDDVQKRVNAYYERMPADADNAQILRRRSAAYTNQGDILLAQGNLAGAFQAYQNGLVIDKKLAAQDPSNTEWQRDVSLSYDRVGDVLVAQGQEEALQAYRDSLAIAQKLVAQDPSNTQWQIDLVVSFWKTGTNLDIASESARQEAKDKLRQGLQILRSLQQQDRLAPGYHAWIETLAKRLEAL